jgi:mono/diheme cytochrome c family protein
MKEYVTGILVTGMAVLGIALTLPSAQKGDSAAGKDVFMKKCKICHGADGDGNPGIAKALGITFTPMSSPEIQKKTDAELKKTISEGKGKMKPVKDLSDADTGNVIAFVRTLKK